MILYLDKTYQGKVAFFDSEGSPARVDGQPSWESSAPSIADVVASEDGFSCNVVFGGSEGMAIITCKADADLEAGVQELVLTAEVQVVTGKAVTGTIQFQPV